MDAPPTDGSPSPAAAYEDNCITVCVRARPLNAMEQRSQSGLCLRFMDGKSLVIFENGIPSNDGGGGGMDDRSHSFSFDHAYDPNVPQDQVYEDLGRPVLLSSFGGFNTCIFAYGQTGSGKSYCMMGPNGGRDLQVSPGIIPRLCEQLFKEAHRRQQEASAAIAREAAAGAEPHALPPELEVHVYISYLEIYREKVRCLLRKDGSEESLKVRQHPVLGVYVEGLTEVPVTTVDHITQLMAMGNESRHIASTKMNDSSSRSHAIFAIQLVQKRKSTLKDGSAKITELRAKINLVDLAGSERAKSTGAEGDTLREGALINRSLTTLGLVISALADASKAAANPSTSGAQAKAKHVPYRDSTLTFLLKESLGGNSKTFMLSTLSPALINYEETLSTLRYADRAKAIMTRAFVNESAGDKRIRELEDEVTKLREQLRHVAETAQASPNSHAARERLVGDDEAMDDHHGDDDDDNAAPANGGVDALKEELRLAEEIIKQLSATDADRARAAGIGFTDGAQSSAVRLDRKDPYLLNMDGAGDWVYAHVAPGQRLFVGAPSSFVADDIDLDSCDSSLALSSEGDGADHTRGDGEAVGMVTVAGEKHIIIPFELCEGIGAPHCSINVLQDGTARLCPEAGCDTYLNDSSSPVREEVAIRSGDLIFIGAEELQFRFMNPAEPPMTARGRRAVTQAAAAAAASASGAEAGNNVVPPSRLPLLSQPKRGAEPPSAPTAAAVVPRLSMPSTTGPAAHVDPTTSSAIPSLNLTSLGGAAAKAAHPAAPSIPPPALSLAPPAPAAAGPTGAKCFSRAPVAASASSTADSDPFNPAGFTPASSTFFKEERERVCRHTFLFLGPEQSGKTAIRQNLPQEDRSWFNSFFSKDQNRTHLPTWGVDRSTITVQGLEEVQLYLVELGGSCFSMMQDQLPSRRVTYVLCFSLATQPTIDTFRQTLELILYQADRSEVPVVLMGTHADQSCLKDRELHDVMDEFGQEVQRFFQMLQPNPALRPHIIGRFAINNQSRTVQGTGLGRIQSFPDLLLWLGEHALTQAKSDEDFPNALVPRRCMALYNAVRALKNTANWCLSAAEYKALAKNVDARYGLTQNDLNAHTQLLDSWGLLKHRFRHTVLRRAVVVHVRWFMDVLASVCCATLASTNDSNNLLFLDALRTYGKNMPFPPESLTRADAHSLLSRGIITTKVLAVIVSCTLRRGAAQPPSASFLAERVRQVFDLLQRCDIAIAGSRLHLHHKASNGGPTTSTTTTTTGTIATPLATSATSPFEGFLLLPFKLTAPPPPAIAMYLPQLLTGPFYRFNFNMTPPHFFAKVVARATAVVGEVYLGPAHPWKVPRDRSFFPLCVRPPQPSSHTTHTLNHNAAPSAEAAMTPPPDAVVLPAVDSPLWGSTAWLMGSDGSRALMRMLPHSLYISFHSSTPSEEMVEQQPNISTDLFTSVLEVVRGVLGESPGARGEESVLCAPAGAEGPSRGRFDGDLLHDDNNVVVVATAEPPRTQPPRMFYRLLTENMNNAERNSERERVALLSARGSRTSMDHTNPTAAELSGFYTQSTTEPIKAEALVAVLEASFTTSKVVSEDVLQAAEAWNVAAQSPSATPASKGAAMDALVAALSLV